MIFNLTYNFMKLLFLLPICLITSVYSGLYKKVTSDSLTWIPRTTVSAGSQIECGSKCSLDPTCSGFLYQNSLCYVGDKYSIYNGISASGMSEVYVPLSYSVNGFPGLLTTTTTPGPPTTSYTPSCFYNVTSPGKISSPGYPSNYANYLLCGWEITAPSSQMVKIAFNDFATERGFDLVELYDITISATVPVYKFSGLQMPSPSFYQTNKNTLTVKFRTDHAARYRGFDATITFKN